jgi:2-furoyl-CoA dehydrogenase large subunit
VYFALERLMQRIGVILDLDPLQVIRRNLVETFPYRCPAGAVLDSGDYGAAVDVAVARGRLAELRRRSRRGRPASTRLISTPIWRRRCCPSCWTAMSGST